MTSKVYNKEALNNFTSMMMDVQIPRNPLASEVILVFNDSIRDQYQDVIVKETSRVKKLAIVKKDPDMMYVQQETDILLEDNIDKIPWLIKFTMTDLPRRPRAEDQVVVEGLRYNVSYAQPLNRSLNNIMVLTVYPDRSDIDQLRVYRVDFLFDGYLDILYGGAPIEYSFDERSINSKEFREKFTSRPPLPEQFTVGQTFNLYIFDKDNNNAFIEVTVPELGQ